MSKPRKEAIAISSQTESMDTNTAHDELMFHLNYAAILIMTKTYPISGFGGRFIGLPGL
jgi:hypothetical protein